MLNDSPFRSSYAISPKDLNRSTYVRNDLEQSKMISNVASGKSKFHHQPHTTRRHRGIFLPTDPGKEPRLVASERLVVRSRLRQGSDHASAG